MKREEKNQITIRKILDSALIEFSQQGYGASSVNTICAAENISKGNLYHYFPSKDALFLACVEECFSLLTHHIKNAINQSEKKSIEEKLSDYFSARKHFFQLYPKYQGIFSEAVINPPQHLIDEIKERKKVFDLFNEELLRTMLSDVKLAKNLTIEDAIRVVKEFQDFSNSKTNAFEKHENDGMNILYILLYGMIERKEYEE